MGDSAYATVNPARIFAKIGVSLSFKAKKIAGTSVFSFLARVFKSIPFLSAFHSYSSTAVLNRNWSKPKCKMPVLYSSSTYSETDRPKFARMPFSPFCTTWAFGKYLIFYQFRLLSGIILSSIFLFLSSYIKASILFKKSSIDSCLLSYVL
jgi:hypothetical protein